jgi:hypothetical protein
MWMDYRGGLRSFGEDVLPRLEHLGLRQPELVALRSTSTKISRLRAAARVLHFGATAMRATMHVTNTPYYSRSLYARGAGTRLAL